MRAAPLGSASLFETLGVAPDNRKMGESAFALQMFSVAATPRMAR
jgi:hypothetical protein